VDLLVDLKATEAIAPMLQALSELDLDDIMHSRIVVRLPDLGPAVLEPALAMLAEERALDDEDVDDGDVDDDVVDDEDGDDAGVDETVSALCEVLSKLGIKDERVFEALCWQFERGETWTAGAFANYGDKRALPILEAALAAFEPDFSYIYGGTDLMDLIEAYEPRRRSLPRAAVALRRLVRPLGRDDETLTREPAGADVWQDGQERPVPLRQRQEVQEVLPRRG